MEDEIKALKEDMKTIRAENHNMKEQLGYYIPRRKVRRVYKMLGKILDEDTNTTFYVTMLKDFINKIEKEGKAEVGQEIKTAIEHLLSVRER